MAAVEIEVKPSGPLQLGDWTVLARIDGEVVGRLSGGKWNAVEKIYVVPEHRRKGIASQMFRALLEREPNMRMPDEFSDSGAAWFSTVNPAEREYYSTWGTDPNWSAWMRQGAKESKTASPLPPGWRWDEDRYGDPVIRQPKRNTYGPVLTRAEAEAGGWEGPFYHGTSPTNARNMRQRGFREVRFEPWELSLPGTQEDIDPDLSTDNNLLIYATSDLAEAKGYGAEAVMVYLRPGAIRRGMGSTAVGVVSVADVAVIKDVRVSSKTASGQVRVSTEVPLVYNMWVSHRLSLHGPPHPANAEWADKVERVKAKWKEANPGKRQTKDLERRWKSHKAGPYFNPFYADEKGGVRKPAPADLLAFVDVGARSDYVSIAYLTVREDQRGRGLARDLIQAVYDQWPEAMIDWGKLMQAEMGHLYDDFKQTDPERTRGGSNYYSSKTALAPTDLLHRGIWVEVPSGKDRVRTIIEAVRAGGGHHWTPDEDWARRWAIRFVPLTEPDRVHAVVTVRHPGEQAVQTDPQWLKDHGVGQYAISEPEVAIRPGSPLQVVKVAWWEESDRDPADGTWHEQPTSLRTTASTVPPLEEIEALVADLRGGTRQLGICGRATAEVQRRFGYPKVEGFYSGADSSGRRVWIPHAWNALPGGDVLDPTSDQFGYQMVRVVPRSEAGAYQPLTPAQQRAREEFREENMGREPGVEDWAFLAAKTALPSWRDRGARPEAEAVIVPDQGRARRNSFEVFLYGQPHGRRPSFEEAKAMVEEIYGPLEWTKVPGDTDPHNDPVWGETAMFNDAPHHWVVQRLPRLGTTAISDPPEGLRIEREDEFTVNAYLGDQLVGYLWFGEGEISYVRVEPAYRRQGIATALYRYVEDTLGIPLEHMSNRTPEGRAWSEKVGERLAIAATTDSWRPTGGMFGRGSDTLDPRVFDLDTQQMRRDIHGSVMGALEEHWTPLFGDWRAWAKVYLAGSGASYWWDSDADMDILIGVDLARLREARPANKEVADSDVLGALNRTLKDLSAKTTQMNGFVTTWFVNGGSYDIRAIHPYAAYDITDDEWVVKPPVLPANWGPSSIPEETWRRCEMAARSAQQVLSLPEPERTVAGTVYFDWVHDGRKASYSAYGGGWLDAGNVIYQYLGLHPERLLRRLYLCKHPEEAPEAIEATAASTITVYRGIYLGLESGDYDHLPGAITQRILSGGNDYSTGTSRQNLGVHWTTDRRVAEHWATPMTRSGEQPTLGSDGWGVDVPVVITARVSSADVVTDPEALRDAMVEGHGWEGLPSTTRLPEKEALIRPGASIEIQSIEALSPSQWWRLRQAVENFTAGNVRNLKVQWKRLDGGMRAVAAKPEVVYEFSPTINPDSEIGQHSVSAEVDGERIGLLSWFAQNKKINNVFVIPKYRRMGIATEMLRVAREHDTVLHNENLSPDGYYWSQHVGATDLRLELVANGDPISGRNMVWEARAFGSPLSEQHGSLAGYLRFDSSGRRVRIKALEVNPGYQRQGVATWLLGQFLRSWDIEEVDPGEFTPAGAALWKKVTGETVSPSTSMTLPNSRDWKFAAFTGGTIYRGLRADLPPDVEAKVRDLVLTMETDEESYAKWKDKGGKKVQAGELIVRALEKSHWEPGSGLGRHWTTRREMAVGGAMQGGAGSWPILLTATYDPSDVDTSIDPDAPFIHTESEVPLRPGAPITVTQVDVCLMEGGGGFSSKGMRVSYKPIQSVAAKTIDMTPEMGPEWKGNGIYEMDISHWSSTGCVALMGDVAGMAFPFGWLTWDRDRFTIEGIYVNPDYRGKGIGVEMMRAAEKIAGRPLDNDSGEYTPEGYAWAKKRGINPKMKNRISQPEMSQMVARMNNLLMGSTDLIKQQVKKVGSRTARIRPMPFAGLDGPLARRFDSYDAQSQRDIKNAVRALEEGTLAEPPEAKWLDLKGYYTIPAGALSESSTPDRVLLKRSPQGWKAVYYVPHHNYENAKRDLDGWERYLQRTADYNMAYYAIDWSWQDWLDRKAGGRGQHDLTKTRTMPLLMRLAETILADHGHADVDVVLNRANPGMAESEAFFEWNPNGRSVLTLSIGNEMRNKWTILHEMSHGLDLAEGGDEAMYFDNHGPAFKRRFTSLLKRYGGPDGAQVDLERRAGGRVVGALTQTSPEPLEVMMEEESAIG